MSCQKTNIWELGFINKPPNQGRPLAFSTLNLRNKDNSVLKRSSFAFYVEVRGNSSDGKTKPATWFGFKNPIIAFNKGITTNSSYFCTNMATWSLPI